MTYESLEQVKSEYGFQCADHPLDVPWDDLVELLQSKHWCGCGEEAAMCGSYCDHRSYAVVRLRDGRFGVLEEWSDSSGHG